MRNLRRVSFARMPVALGTLAALSVLAVSVPGVLAQAKSQPKPAVTKPATSNPGLVGLLPAEAPYDLNEESFEALDGNWAPVRSKISGLIEKLYTDKSLNIVGQRRVIEELKGQVRLIRAGIEQPRNKPVVGALVTLHGRLARRVGLAEALLDAVTISTKPVKPKAAGGSPRQKLVKSVAALLSYLKSFGSGATWIDYLSLNELTVAIANQKPTATQLGTMRLVYRALQEKASLGNADQIAFLEEKEFAAVETGLGAYLKVAGKPKAAPKPPSEPLDSKTRATLRPHLATLAAAIDSYEETASRAAAGRARKALMAIRAISSSQYEQLGSALRPHYLGYNVRVVASEKLLGRYVGQTRVEKRPVREVILGAQVSGTSLTTATVGIDLLASQDGARFMMVLGGKTITDTRADKRGASIFTHGEHIFNASKLVHFDGDRFRTEPAEVSVDANNTIVDVQAKSSLVRRIARKKAIKLMPRSEEIAAEKVAADVGPEFNSEVDKQFKQATIDLAKHINGPLEQYDLSPAGRSITSTDTELRVSSQLMGSGELAAGLPNPSVVSKTGVVVHLHESAINNALDRMELAGKTMTEDDLKVEFEKRISTFLGRDFHFESEAKASDDNGPTTLIFAAADPVRVRIADGQFVLIIRAGLKQDAGKEDIPAQVVTMPFDIKIEGDNLMLVRGSVKVSAVSKSRSRAKQIVRAGVVRKKLTSALKNRSLVRRFDIERDDADPVKLTVTRVEAIDGWLSIVVE